MSRLDSVRPAFVSVVIPVLGDAGPLRTTLEGLERTLARPDAEGSSSGGARAAEVLVAGVSWEVATLRSVCAPYAHARVVEAPPGRARQMNAGAQHASARWVLFLHADSQPHETWLEEIARADAGGYAWGCFRFALDDRSLPARTTELWVRQRVRLAHLPYGDQGIFVRRDLFERLGGYAELPLMEDVDLVSRLRPTGRMYASEVRVTTSARRWRRDGWIRRSLSNNLLLALYHVGVSPAWLARTYARRQPAALVVLARAPSAPGKTRLWRELAREPDERLLWALLLDTVEAASALRRTDLYLFVTPPSAVSEVAGQVPGARVLAQRGDELGARMQGAFEDLFGLGYRSVLLMGSDLPSLPPAILLEAQRQLGRRGIDVVLGPAEDGGYFLIGLHRPCPALFAGIQWSRPDVLARTLRRARAARLRPALIGEWYDVDDATSLERAATCRSRAPRTGQWWSTERGKERG